MTGDINWKEVFYYDETSPSCLRWACNIPYRGLYEGSPITYKRVVGDIAGSWQKTEKRYKLKYRQKAYMAHRIIYELFHGVITDELVIDHKDGNASNNKINNLRAVTDDVNKRNMKKNKNNKTGVTGVVYFELITGNKVYAYCTACWELADKSKRKNFSVNKLGYEEAFRLACEYRAKMIEELNAQGAGYTEDHGKRIAS